MQAVTEYRWDQRLDQAQIHLRMRRIAHFSVGSNVFRLFLRKGIKNEEIVSEYGRCAAKKMTRGLSLTVMKMHGIITENWCKERMLSLGLAQGGSSFFCLHAVHEPFFVNGC